MSSLLPVQNHTSVWATTLKTVTTHQQLQMAQAMCGWICACYAWIARQIFSKCWRDGHCRIHLFVDICPQSPVKHAKLGAHQAKTAHRQPPGVGCLARTRHLYVVTGPWFNIKMWSYQYRKSHCGDKTVVRSSYLHNGISYTGKMSSLYWTNPLVLFVISRVCEMVIINMRFAILIHYRLANTNHLTCNTQAFPLYCTRVSNLHNCTNIDQELIDETESNICHCIGAAL